MSDDIDIPSLIERAKERVAYHDRVAAVLSNMGKPRTDNDAGRTAQLIEDLAAAIERMARVIETQKNVNNLVCEKRRAAEARIRELEEHCDRLGRGGAERYWEGRWRDAEADRDAIQAKTIEECLDAVYWFHNVERFTIGDVAARIRALMPAKDTP